jgi:hypothetical protein
MSKCCSVPSLDILLSNVNRNITKKRLFDRIGHSEKALSFDNAITKLNSLFGTSFYMERNGREFTIQGHREYGHLSRRNGILGSNIDVTLGVHEIEKAGSENTIKLITDNNNNFVMVSLLKMKELGCFNKTCLDKRLKPTRNNTIPYFTWSLEELDQIRAIIYKSIQN